MKITITRTLFIVIFSFLCLDSHSQTQDAKIKKCEQQATPFKDKIDQNHIYAYIAHVAYIDCLIAEFPDYKQQYIDTQISPNMKNIRQWGALSEMPPDSRTLLKKYWNVK